MNTFVVLLFAHLLGDFPLQTNRVFQMKLANKRGLALHVAIHVITAAALIRDFWLYWQLLLALAIIHYLTDYIKIKLQKPGQPLTAGFIWDQVAHYITIGVLAWWQPDVASLLPLWLLIPAVILATIPAIMTLIWVWANDHYIDERLTVTEQTEWLSKKLLPISQRFGWGIMGAVFLLEMLRSFWL